MLTLDLATHDRLRAEEEERKRRERELIDLGRGAMSNLLTLFDTPDQVNATLARVKDETGLVTLDRAYQDINMRSPMTRDTFADFLTEYTDPGHLEKTFQTAQDQGILTDPAFAQKTADRFSSLAIIAAQARSNPLLGNEHYWQQMSLADQGQPPIDTAQRAIQAQGGPQTPQQVELANAPTGLQQLQAIAQKTEPIQLEQRMAYEKTGMFQGATIGPAPEDTPEMVEARKQLEQQGVTQGLVTQFGQQAGPILEAMPKEYPAGANVFMAATLFGGLGLGLAPVAPVAAGLATQAGELYVGEKAVTTLFPKAAEVAGKVVSTLAEPGANNLIRLGVPESIAKPLNELILFGAIGKAPAGQTNWLGEAVSSLKASDVPSLAKAVTALRQEYLTPEIEAAAFADGRTSDWLSLGARVRAADRQNLGTVVSYDPDTKVALVHFWNKKEGTAATVALHSFTLSPAGAPATKAAAKEAATAMEGAVAAAKAQEAGPLVGKMYRTLESAEYLTAQQAREATIATGRHRAAGAIEAIRGKSTPATFESSMAQAGGALQGKVAPDLGLVESWTAQEIHEFGNGVLTSSLLKPLEGFRGGKAVKKLLEAKQVLMPSEARLIGKVYPELMPMLAKATAAKNLSLIRQIADIANIPRVIQASYDLSFPLRQGGLLIGRKEFWQALDPMIRAGISKDAANAEIMKMVEDPLWDRAVAAGLPIGDPGTGIVQEKLLDIPKVEEAWITNLASKIPGVAQSQRAYTTAGNNMRWNHWVNQVREWDALGIGGPAREKAFATWTGIATGWGKIGNLEKILPELSTVLFAPRFLASRLEALPMGIYYALKNPIMARSIAYDLTSFVASQASLLALMKYGIDGKGIPGVSVELDPRSTDVGRIKIGNTRIDTLAGFQPIFRTVAQLIKGQGKGATGEFYSMNRWTTLGRYGRSKLAPGFGSLADVLAGESYIGEPMEATPGGLGRIAQNRFMPFLIHDIKEAVAGNSPGVAALVGVLGLFGATTLTYETPWQKLEDTRDKASQTLYKMSLADLRKQYGTPAANAMIAADPAVVAADKAVEARKAWYGTTNTSLKTALLPFTAEQLKVDTALLDPQRWKEDRQRRQDVKAGFIAGFYYVNAEQRDRMVKEREKIGDPFTIPKGALPDDIVARYLAIFTDHTNVDTGTVDDRDALYLDLDRFQAMLTLQQATWLEGNLGLKATPREKTYFAGLKKLQPYFDIPEQVYQKDKEKLGLTAATYAEYRTQADMEAQVRAQAEGLGPEMVGAQHYSNEYRQLDAEITYEWERYWSNPVNAEIGIKTGIKSPSQADIARAQQGGLSAYPSLDLGAYPSLDLPLP